MTEIILVSLSCLIITAYLALYICHCGIPTSLSDTYYHTERKWLFPTVIATSAGLALIPFIDITPDDWKFLAFLSIVAIFFIAAAPAFRESLVKSVHCGAALLLCATVSAWLVIVADQIPIIAITGIIIGICNRSKFVFWLEVGLLYDLYLNLIVLLIYCSRFCA